jgi:hypothetical protein
MQIKNDKARKEWLAGLKDGDEVAMVDEDGEVRGIGPVQHRLYPPSFGVDSQRFTLRTGKRIAAGSTAGGWIVPLTDDVRARHEQEKRVLRAIDRLQQIGRFWGSTGWRQFTDDQILAVSAILWPEQKQEGGA